MSTSSRSDYGEKDVVRLLAALAESASVRAYAEALVAHLGAVVPADILAYNDVTPQGPTLMVSEPPMELGQVEADVGRYADEHPLIVHYRETGDPSAMRTSDLVRVEEFRATTLHKKVFAPFDVDYVMSAVLRDTPDRFAAIALLRREHDFAESEKQRLEQLRPALSALLDRSVAVSRYEALRVGLTTAGFEIVEVDRRGQLGHASERGRTRLRRFFGHDHADFPTVLHRWVEDRVGQAVAAVRAPFVREQRGQRLIVRLVSGSRLDARVLLLEVQGGPPSLNELTDEFELTTREAEVLQLVIGGLGNKEIAETLHLAHGTVKKHLERIFRRLGVSSRSAAVALVLRTQEPAD